MEVYCESCGEKKAMRRVRKPKNGRRFALLSFLVFVVLAFSSIAGFLSVLFLVLSLVLMAYGRNYWECETCGRLTKRV